MDPKTLREKEWHNKRFADGGDTREDSKVRFAYEACEFASERFLALQNPTNARVLDIGCGKGIARAEKFLQQNCSYTGIDISEECIRANTESALQNGLKATYICDDANTLDKLSSEAYDLIILSGTLHHLDIEKSLARFRQLLSKEGKLLMWEPMGENPFINIFRRLTPRLRSPDEHPLRFRDLARIRQLFPRTRVELHTFSSLAVIPFAMLAHYKNQLAPLKSTMSSLLGRLDMALGKLPFVKRMHWIVIIEASR